MEELLRISDARQEESAVQVNRLRGYYLELYSGEIVYIYGRDASGIRRLRELLSGETFPVYGKLYLQGSELHRDDHTLRLTRSIYICRGGEDLLGNMTVAENLALISGGRSPFRLWSRDAAREAALHLLQEAQLGISPDLPLHSLTYAGRLKISLIKARAMAAKIIVLDCLQMQDEEFNTAQLGDLLQRYRSEGISILILSERINPLAAISDRFQLMNRGRDRMEWAGPEAVKYFTDVREKTDAQFPGTTAERRIKAAEPWQWDRHAAAASIFIPRESAVYLPDNLTVAQNVILSVPGRVARGLYGYINPAIERSAAARFYLDTGIDPGKTSICQLTYVERKILSVYRHTLARPQRVILEDAFWGMEREEASQLQTWLDTLPAKGIEVMHC